MNWSEYSKLWEHHAPSQEKFEYYMFLMFVKAYFEFRKVLNPLVVEIGVRGIKQAHYYKRFFNAEYFGIDIQDKHHPDIITGDSSKPETVEKLKQRLAGRPIDLLFIDGWHAYENAKADWDNYSLLTKHLVAIHDINWMINYMPDNKNVNPEKDMPSVNKLWRELDIPSRSMISFRCPGTIQVNHSTGPRKYYGDPGIGVVIMDRDEIENRWVFEEGPFGKMWGTDGRAYPRFGKI